MISEKELDKLEDLLEEEIKKFTKQGGLQNILNESKALKDILESVKIIHCLREGGYSTDEGYSGNSYGYSGGWGRSRHPISYNGNVNFDGAYSGRRMSRYSGHSIHDRMIASLESLYDQATSQHEKDEISAWIGRLRTEN